MDPHPGLSVFVSSRDREVHALFSSWWQIALVVDPRRRAVSAVSACATATSVRAQACSSTVTRGPRSAARLRTAWTWDTAEAPGKSWPEPWDEEVSPVTSPYHVGGDGFSFRKHRFASLGGDNPHIGRTTCSAPSHAPSDAHAQPRAHQ